MSLWRFARPDSNGKKFWIPGPAVFNKFSFNGSKLFTVPQVLIDAIPQGVNIG